MPSLLWVLLAIELSLDLSLVSSLLGAGLGSVALGLGTSELGIKSEVRKLGTGSSDMVGLIL